MQIRFIKPMAAIATITREVKSLSGVQTKLSLSNTGVLKYPLNILIPLMEKHVAKDMGGALITLKNILEK